MSYDSYMTIPQAHYVIDQNGEKVFVQLSIQDWERFVAEVVKLNKALEFKSQLKAAFREAKEIQRGEKQGQTLKSFLDEL